MSADPFLKLFLILVIYIIVLLIIRTTNFGKKKIIGNCNNSCPDCNAALNRIKRTRSDRLTFHLTFRIFELKRYLCNECGWEGLRWEDKYRPNS